MGIIRYSEDFKIDVVKKCQLHGSTNWVADIFGVPPDTLRTWIREYGTQSGVPVCQDEKPAPCEMLSQEAMAVFNTPFQRGGQG